MPSWHAQVRGQADDTVDGICVSGFILHYLVHRCKLRPLFGPVNNTASIIKNPPQPKHHYLSYLTCKGPSAAETCFVVSPCLYGHLITRYQEVSLISPQRKPSSDSFGICKNYTQFFYTLMKTSSPWQPPRELLPSKNRCLCCVSSISW